ncbi:hypothetical protein D8911_03435 [Levilactobacillus brevis]|nr:hypothetical protein D8911_03435 [Levilactobacillus brevis]
MSLFVTVYSTLVVKKVAEKFLGNLTLKVLTNFSKMVRRFTEDENDLLNKNANGLDIHTFQRKRDAWLDSL